MDHGKPHIPVDKGGITTTVNGETVIMAWVRLVFILESSRVLTAPSTEDLLRARQLGATRASEEGQASSSTT